MLEIYQRGSRGPIGGQDQGGGAIINQLQVRWYRSLDTLTLITSITQLLRLVILERAGHCRTGQRWVWTCVSLLDKCLKPVVGGLGAARAAGREIGSDRPGQAGRHRCRSEGLNGDERGADALSELAGAAASGAAKYR